MPGRLRTPEPPTPPANTQGTEIKRLKPSRGAWVHRGFRLLWSAILATSFGFHIQRTLELWLIYEMTGSALHLGLTGLARGVPVFVLSLWGGVLADRIDRRRFVMRVQACNAVLNLALALLAVTGLIEAWHIYVSAFMSASFNAVGAPSRNAMVPGLVPRAALLNALSLTAMSRKLSQLFGPVLTGFLIAWAGSGITYALNGAVYLSAVFLVGAIAYTSDRSKAPGSPFRSLMEGIAFVRNETAIWMFLGMELVTVYFGSHRALLPIFVAGFGAGAEAFGVLLSASAGGAIVGVAGMLSLGDVRYKGLWVTFGVLAYAACLGILGLSGWFLLSAAAVFLLGLFEAVQMLLCNVIVQTTTPDHLRGRILSFQRMLGVGGPSLGEAQSGFVAAFIGAPLTLLAGAAVCAGTALGLMTFRKEIRRANL